MTDDHQEGFIEVAGRRIWFRKDGATRSGVPLLAIHGGPGLSHEYLTPLLALSSERPVILYDQLGCGTSEKPDGTADYTLDYYVRELAIVREQLGLNEVHILGQSWGTMVAVEYMLTMQPSGVKSLILSAPCLSASRWYEDQRRYIEALPSETRDTIARCEADGTCDSPEYQEAMEVFYGRHVCRMDPMPTCLEESISKMAFDIYGYMWGPSEFTITGTLQTFERAEDLAGIQVPTLFTCGKYDEACPDTTRYYHRMTPGSRMVVFEDASHSHHLEQETTYIDRVRDFLASVEAQNN